MKVGCFFAEDTVADDDVRSRSVGGEVALEGGKLLVLLVRLLSLAGLNFW